VPPFLLVAKDEVKGVLGGLDRCEAHARKRGGQIGRLTVGWVAIVERSERAQHVFLPLPTGVVLEVPAEGIDEPETPTGTNSLGQRYPAVSDIQHAYEQSSLSSNGAFAVTVAINFSVRYRVSGGAWQALDPITRSVASAYPVQQLQSILTGR
jgi:hypothetical protein